MVDFLPRTGRLRLRDAFLLGSRSNFGYARQCRCSCNLSKPSQRLQRLIHSMSSTSSFDPLVSNGLLGATGQAGPSGFRQQTEEEMRELKLLVDLLPARLRNVLLSREDINQLLEVVLDLGRPPIARVAKGDVRLSEDPITQADLEAAVSLLGDFGDDNRAGIDRTLHRVSCMRNRDGAIVGLTCRVGRAISGCASLAADFALAGKSLLILGKPGVGKTTAIRELARLLADEIQKRVVIVDTSNEIGGDGDIPHNGVGSSRRMQVAHCEEQHRVMIEAVENHMPEVIVIDEIGTEAEALAARTIAQRGVQLIATAHGGHLDNLIKNPSLKDLVGGVEIVTLGDDLARKRGTQKSVQERAAPPTFDVAIELLDRRKWCIHPDIGKAVDSILSGQKPSVEVRQQDENGKVHKVASQSESFSEAAKEAQAQSSRAQLMRNITATRLEDDQPDMPSTERFKKSAPKDQAPIWSERYNSSIQPLYIHLVGVDHDSAERAIADLGDLGEELILTSGLESADVVLAVRSDMKTGSSAREAAKAAAVPVYAIKSSAHTILVKALGKLAKLQESPPEPSGVLYQNHVVSRGSTSNEAEALEEAQQALEKVVLPTRQPIELLPRTKEIILQQIDLVERSYGLATQIVGKGVQIRLRILPSIALNNVMPVGNPIAMNDSSIAL